MVGRRNVDSVVSKPWTLLIVGTHASCVDVAGQSNSSCYILRVLGHQLWPGGERCLAEGTGFEPAVTVR